EWKTPTTGVVLVLTRTGGLDVQPRLLSLAFLGLVLWSSSSPAPGQVYRGPVELRRWDGTASLVRNPGPGGGVYRFTASTTWGRRAPRGVERYQVRLTLPDGRVETQTLGRDNGPGAPVLHVFVPRNSVRNLLPGAVRVLVQLVDAFTGASASNPLVATIDQFPTPRFVAVDKRPFGWGKPLTPDESGAVELPGPGPDGLEFVRVPAANGQPAFYISRYEVSNRQVKAKLQGEYDPSAGRS